jgi:hypothetical protein
MNYEDLEGEFLQYASIVKLTEGQEMTITEIGAAITSINNSANIIKTAVDIRDGLKNSELTLAISTMNRELAKIQDELAAKQREITAKDDEIDRLKKQLAQPKTKTGLVKIQAYWYTPEDAMNPVCSACNDSQDKVIRLVPTDRSTKMMTKHKYQCPNCKTTS